MSLIERSTTRAIKITPHINPYADGSVLVEYGNTRVHVTAFWEESLPPWLRGKGKGWVSAEYSMLPGSTHTRGRRDRKGISGRSQEIQRLIGRALRSVVQLEVLGERSLMLDCDVLIADGGTRTASITGSFVAMKLAIDKLRQETLLSGDPLKEFVAAISIGINDENKIIADLNYEEDSTCHTDMNIVMTESGRFVEIQGTAEGEPFTREQMNAILDCAYESLRPIFEVQKSIFESP